ncbi:MAG TPA: metal ABC transporter permease [Gammaproteobacteria bacterium]|nr:metal ABC transporter permease [Gammaproteobacteria bacterium]
MDTLLEPLQFEFFRHGLLAALMVGGLCGLIGVYIVLKGMSYIGHGLSHAAFGGAVVGFTFKLNFYVGAAVVGLIAALLINQITRGGKIKSDAAIGIVTTACFALGVAIISRLRHFTQSFEAALFGNILGVDNSDLLVIGSVTGATVVVMFLTYRAMLFTTFDLDAAKVFGIKTGRMQLVFACILTMAIIASMNIVGVTMIAATLVVPAVTARLLTNSFSRMLILSTCLGATIGVAGMYLSYYFNAASGATIVLFGACVFIIVSAINYIKERFILREQTHRHGHLVHTHRAGPGHTRDSHAHEHDHEHHASEDASERGGTT